MDKSKFTILLMLVVVYGGSVGGAFAVGRNTVQLEQQTTVSSSDLPSETSRVPVSNNIDRASIREKIQSGELKREDLMGLGFSGEGPVLREPAVIGTIVKITTDSLQLETNKGDIQININEQTRINKPAEIGDLNVGMKVSIAGVSKDTMQGNSFIQILD
jgi:hypothetical protein